MKSLFNFQVGDYITINHHHYNLCKYSYYAICTIIKNKRSKPLELGVTGDDLLITYINPKNCLKKSDDIIFTDSWPHHPKCLKNEGI